MRPKGPRDPVAGPESGPEPPFPIKLSGPVIKGFGRGSRELGIPTANIPPSGLGQYPDLQSGVYYAFVALKFHPDTTQPADNSKLTLSSGVPGAAGSGQPMPHKGNDATSLNTPNDDHASASEGHTPTGGEQSQLQMTSIYPAVLSIGYNPYYKNETRSIEIHVLHHFPSYNFYHSPLNLLILGFIRPEYDYESLAALVDDIKTDCDVARRSLQRPKYQEYDQDAWLREFAWVDSVDVRKLEEEVTGKDGAKEVQNGGESDGKL